MNILDIFYNHIIPEATTGRIDCLNYYNIIFSTKIIEENKVYLAKYDNDDILIPTLMIKDRKQFDLLLIEYVNKAIRFYDDSNFDNELINYTYENNDKKICKEKVILTLLFANAMTEDFNDPCEFLRRRINFIDNDIRNNYDLGYSDILNGNVSILIKEDIINNETPYQMIIKVISENNEEFVFPKIKLGISDNYVYIYSIQNKEQENTTFNKKINRILYKVGEGFNDNLENNEENLKDVTSSFLVSLNMCIAYLYANGYTNIIVPSYLIERWNAKWISNLLKIKHKNIDIDEAQKIFDKQDYIQYNLTNKLVRTFLRLGCHFNNIDIVAFPYEMDSCLHININDNILKCNNRLLLETYQLINNMDGSNKRRK